jgi:hypothetical protein
MIELHAENGGGSNPPPFLAAARAPAPASCPCSWHLDLYNFPTGLTMLNTASPVRVAFSVFSSTDKVPTKVA